MNLWKFRVMNEVNKQFLTFEEFRKYINGHKTSVDLRMVTEEEIFGIKE